MSCDNKERRTVNDSILNEKSNLYQTQALRDSNILVEDSSGLLLKARLNYEKDEYLQALELYSKLIEIDSSKGEFFFRKGYCLVQLDREPEAIQYYKKAAELNFNPSDCYYNIGLAYHFALNNDSLAIVYYERSLQLNPESKEINKLLSHLKKQHQEL